MNPSAERTDTRSAWVAATAVALLVAVAWIWSADTGRGLQSLALSEGTRDGAWLSDLVVWLLTALPTSLSPNTMLAVFSAGVLGALIAWLYRRLIYNDWPVFEALIFVGALACNSFIVSAVTADHRVIPLMLACAAVIPGIRRLESVGDVQAEMSFGLLLPLLFLAGPATTLLIPMLAVFGALSDSETRRNHSAFVAMFLVAVMPTLLVLTGLVGMLGIDEAVRLATEIYGPAFQPEVLSRGKWTPFLVIFAYAVLPFATLIVAYWLQRDRRRQPWSATAVLVLPVYLLLGGLFFSWPISSAAPAAVFLGAFASWLAVARLTPAFRRVSVALMVLGTIVSWSAMVLASDPAWSAAPIAWIGGLFAS
jgi:hypothetical protein